MVTGGKWGRCNYAEMVREVHCWKGHKPGYWMASGCGKQQRNRSSLEPPEGAQACWHFNFSPCWNSNLQNIRYKCAVLNSKFMVICYGSNRKWMQEGFSGHGLTVLIILSLKGIWLPPPSLVSSEHQRLCIRLRTELERLVQGWEGSKDRFVGDLTLPIQLLATCSEMVENVTYLLAVSAHGRRGKETLGSLLMIALIS